MGGEIKLSSLLFICKTMEFTKKVLMESLEVPTNGKKTYSEKPQNIILTESQLESVIAKLSKEKK
jgi:hypothetical protein